MDHEEENVGGDEDEENVGGDTVDDSDDDEECWDENGDPCLPFIGSWDLPVQLCTAGSSYTIEEAREIASSVYERHYKLFGEWYEMAKNNMTPLTLRPLDVLPKITTTCASEHKCYHRRYWTEITFETASTHPYFRPCGMMQVFSLRLSRHLAHPVNIYGRFAVRDCWEALHNYIFKRSRDDPAPIPQGCSFLPLRGIYVLQCILLDIDLWIKEDGDGSAEKPLFCGYVEHHASKAVFGSKLDGRLQGDCHGLDMHYTFLWDSIETVIEVLAGPEHSSDIRFSASTSGFDDEVELYDGTFCGKGTIFRHFMAVKKQEKLHVVLKTDDSLYKWTF